MKLLHCILISYQYDMKRITKIDMLSGSKAKEKVENKFYRPLLKDVNGFDKVFTLD